MPAPLFTSNPAEYTKLEGLYITEQNPPAFIQGVNASTVGIFGRTLKGPVDTPVEITSESRFLEVFGADRHAGGGAVLNDVWKALLNKPFNKLVIVRAAATGATTASFSAADTDDDSGATPIIKIDASSAGIWGNDVAYRIDPATDANVNHFNLVVRYKGETTTYENLDTSTGNDNLSSVIGDDLANLVVVTKIADGRPLNHDPLATPSGYNVSPGLASPNFAAALDSDLFLSLGTTIATFTEVLAVDGTIANTDYISSGRAFDQIKAYKGVSMVFMADGGSQTITASVNSTMHTFAASTGSDAPSDRMFLMWYGSFGQTVTTVAGDAASFRSDRVIYCYNAPYTLDTEAGVNVQTAPHSWMASIMSQTDVDIHPGEEATKGFTSGIAKLSSEGLNRLDYITLRDAGIAALEKDADGGFLFVSGVTTDLTSGKTEITRRRSADFLQLSVADRLKFFVKKKNLRSRRVLMRGEIETFLRELQREERVVENFGVSSDGNTAVSRAQGKEEILMRVDLIDHMLHIILKTEIGAGVVIAVG